MEAQVLSELLTARKTTQGLSPTGMTACPTIAALLGDGDPLVAFTQLQARVLQLIAQDDDILAIQAAAYSLGFASDRTTHLDRLTDFGTDYGFEARQARRHSDTGLRRLAHLICSNWIVQTVPTCDIHVNHSPAGTLTLMVSTRWQWFVDMKPPTISLVDDRGGLTPVKPTPVFTQPTDPASDPKITWLTSHLKRPLTFSMRQQDDDLQAQVSWVGEVWPCFTVTVVGPLTDSTQVRATIIGNTAVLRLEAM